MTISIHNKHDVSLTIPSRSVTLIFGENSTYKSWWIKNIKQGNGVASPSVNTVSFSKNYDNISVARFLLIHKDIIRIFHKAKEDKNVHASTFSDLIKKVSSVCSSSSKVFLKVFVRREEDIYNLSSMFQNVKAVTSHNKEDYCSLESFDNFTKGDTVTVKMPATTSVSAINLSTDLNLAYKHSNIQEITVQNKKDVFSFSLSSKSSEDYEDVVNLCAHCFGNGTEKSLDINNYSKILQFKIGDIQKILEAAESLRIIKVEDLLKFIGICGRLNLRPNAILAEIHSESLDSLANGGETWRGIYDILKEISNSPHSNQIQSKISKFKTCSYCSGSGIDGNSFPKIQGFTICDVFSMNTSDFLQFIKSTIFLPDYDKNNVIATILSMIAIGLKNINLNFLMSDVSYGERKKIGLVQMASTKHSGSLFVFDDITVGLDEDSIAHASLLLKKIAARGNYVLATTPILQKSIFLSSTQVLQSSYHENRDISYPALQSMDKSSYNEEDNYPKFSNTLTKEQLRDFHLLSKEEKIVEIYGKSGIGKTRFIKNFLITQALRRRKFSYNEICLLSQDHDNDILFSNTSSPMQILDLISPILKRAFKSNNPAEKIKCSNCKGTGNISKRILDSKILFPCKSCNQTGINMFWHSKTILEKSFLDILNLSAKEMHIFLISASMNHSASKIKTLLDLGLGNLKLNRAYNFYSDGEKRLINFAKTCNSILFSRKQKHLLILDEPFNYLSSSSINKIKAKIDYIKNSKNVTMVVTHSYYMHCLSNDSCKVLVV